MIPIRIVGVVVRICPLVDRRRVLPLSESIPMSSTLLQRKPKAFQSHPKIMMFLIGIVADIYFCMSFDFIILVFFFISSDIRVDLSLREKKEKNKCQIS